MRLYWEIARRSFRRHLTYRAAAVAGLITNFGFGWLRVSVLLALYGGRSVVEGLTVSGLYAYVALTQAVINYIALFGWFDLMNSVHTGEVGTDLLKPMSYFQFWLAQDAGRALVAFLLRGVVIMLLFSLVFPITYPTSLGQWLALLTAVLLSWLVSFHLSVSYQPGCVLDAQCAGNWPFWLYSCHVFLWLFNAAPPLPSVGANNRQLDAISAHAQHGGGGVFGYFARTGLCGRRC